MPPSRHFQVTALGPPIPMWQAVFVLIQLARGETFPNVDKATVIASQAAITARGIQLPPEDFDGLVRLYYRLSHPEKIGLRSRDPAKMGPQQNIGDRYRMNEASMLNGSRHAPGLTPIAGADFEAAFKDFLADMASASPDISSGQRHQPHPDRFMDLSTALPGAGEFTFDSGLPASPSTDMTPLLPKQTNTSSQDLFIF